MSFVKEHHRLAFKIAEEIVKEFPTGVHPYYLDDLAKLIAMHLPMSMEELEREYDELRKPPVKPKGPSLFSQLRKAVHASDECSLSTVLQVAIDKLTEQKL